MKYIIIVNKNGLLSACPTEEVFEKNAFHTDSSRFIVKPIKMTLAVYNHLYKNRDDAYILGDGLPARVEMADRFYYLMKDGELSRVN